MQRQLNGMEQDLKDTTTELYNQESAMKKAADQAITTGNHLKAAGASMKTFGRKHDQLRHAAIVAAGGAAAKQPWTMSLHSQVC
jgi:hypothetical protein